MKLIQGNDIIELTADELLQLLLKLKDDETKPLTLKEAAKALNQNSVQVLRRKAKEAPHLIKRVGPIYQAPKKNWVKLLNL
jgi:hypothetical protein